MKSMIQARARTHMKRKHKWNEYTNEMVILVSRKNVARCLLMQSTKLQSTFFSLPFNSTRQQQLQLHKAEQTQIFHARGNENGGSERIIWKKGCESQTCDVSFDGKMVCMHILYTNIMEYHIVLFSGKRRPKGPFFCHQKVSLNMLIVIKENGKVIHSFPSFLSFFSFFS